MLALFSSEWVDSKPENPLFYGHLFFEVCNRSATDAISALLNLTHPAALINPEFSK